MGGRFLTICLGAIAVAALGLAGCTSAVSSHGSGSLATSSQLASGATGPPASAVTASTASSAPPSQNGGAPVTRTKTAAPVTVTASAPLVFGVAQAVDLLTNDHGPGCAGTTDADAQCVYYRLKVVYTCQTPTKAAAGISQQIIRNGSGKVYASQTSTSITCDNVQHTITFEGVQADATLWFPAETASITVDLQLAAGDTRTTHFTNVPQ
jgi:hypothetical protein